MNSKFLGYIINYANKPQYQGLGGFLLVEDWHQQRAGIAYSLETGTIFDSEEEAQKWLQRFPVAKGSQIYEKGKICPVWDVTRRTMSDPTSKASSG